MAEKNIKTRIIHKHDMDYAITKETNCCLDDIENIAEKYLEFVITI